MPLGVALKRLLPGLRLQGGGFVAQGVIPALLPAIVDIQPVFLFKLTAQRIPRLVVSERLVPVYLDAKMV